MPTTRKLRIEPSPSLDARIAAIAAIAANLKLPVAFPPDVEAAAARAAAAPRLPGLDRTDIPFVTIDPPGSMDLDQALHLERTPAGFRVHYAIADVAAFVEAGDAIDIEAHRRGETLYGASFAIPLYPRVLSDGAASLLPGQVRPALLWTIDLDQDGAIVATDVRRARVRSREKLDYAGVQRRIDAGSAEPVWTLLREIGTLRQQVERARGGVTLGLPEVEVGDAGGHWQLAYRTVMPVEDWNAQLSLLTGIAAAALMVRGKVGILRTVPPPDAQAIARLRVTAHALGIAWPDALDYAGFIHGLDPADPRHVAMLVACTSVLRGAGYVAFDGTLPAQRLHSALATEYAHVTAPMRRLCDRYAGEACIALCAGVPVPAWVRDALPGLPDTMLASDRSAHRFERAVIDLAEAMLMQPRIGEAFDGTIVQVESNGRDGSVMLRDPAIEAPVASTHALPLGSAVIVRLVAADPDTRTTRFELVE